MWLPFFHKNLDYLETLGYHFGDFFSAAAWCGSGMVTLHPVGLPHGPKPAALQAFMDGANARRARRGRRSWPTSPIPPQVSECALGLSAARLHGRWGGYTTDPRFAYRADRLAEARALGERLADARDALRPPEETDARSASVELP